MRKPKRMTTEKVKKKIQELTEIGVSDVEIDKKVDASLQSIGTITRKYWKNKMENGKESTIS